MLVSILLAIAVGAAPPTAAPDTAPPAARGAAFRDVAESAGVAVAHRNRSFENPYAHIMEGYTALGAAAAVADFDGDGWEDLFVTDSAEDGKNRLYRNLFGERGELVFEEVAEAAGVAAGNDAENASADALWLDYDGDGRPDLFVVRFGRSLLYRNQGPGEDGRVTFRDVTEEAGLGDYLNSIAAVAFDADRDGDVDLFLANYFQPVDLFDPGTTRFFPESFESAANGGGLTYYRNDGDGTFTDATETAGLAGHTGWSMDLGHADVDHDGDDDLLVASDFGTDRLYVNRLERGPDAEGPLFEDVTEKVLGIDTKKGMNADWGDFDNDGRFDAYVTNITDEYMREGNFLWQNLSEGGEIVLADVARETGTHDTGWGWAGKFLDYDNDGLLDLYVVNGWVSAGPENYVVDVFELILRSSEDDSLDLADVRNWPPMGNKTLSGYQRNRLFHNQGGALFRDVAEEEGVDSIRDARGVAVADFDRDGRLDMYVANANALPHLYRNVGPGPGRGPDEGGGHWLELELEGSGANPEAIGARVWATSGDVRRVRFVDGGNGFAGQSSRRVHFGLGEADTVERLEIAWPSGARQTFENVAADRHWRAIEGQEELVPSVPRPAEAPAEGPAEPGAEDIFREGLAAAEAGDLEAALGLLERATAAAPDELRYGAEYRQVAIRAEAYERSIDFFEALAEEHPDSPEVRLQWGYAHVDKIPAAGAVTAVILANTALDRFTEAIEREESWLALYTRGNSYVYWPPIFGRTGLGIADLEKAVAMSEEMPPSDGAPPAYHAHAYAALGDAHWRLDDLGTAGEVWRRGLERIPGAAVLTERLSRLEEGGEALDEYLSAHYEIGQRVDTSLRELWGEE